MNLRVLLPLAALLLQPACVIVRGATEVVKTSESKKQCHPSQYWDGSKCRHKGQGKGARKHDS
jgi:hypothetical protein